MDDLAQIQCPNDGCDITVDSHSISWPYCSSEHAKEAYARRKTQRQQIGGAHYTGHRIQPIDVIDDYHLDFFAGSAVKYMMRYQEKHGIEDLRKARHYLNMLIAREEGDPQWLLTPP